MRFPLFFVAAAAILSGSFCTPVAAAEPPISDPAFKLQGEYSGDRYSMQVIALGDGEFEIVVFDSPLEKRSSRDNPPRRIDADEDVVADLIDSLAVKRVVRNSPTLDAVPPTDAVVLFDGTQRSLGNWIDGRISSDGFLKQGTETWKTFRDYTLHLEFRTPWMPESSGQARGNSGVYQQGRYEVQVLDSFGLSGAKNEAGAIYEIHAPAINACLPPMQWQTYDIDFTAARYKGDSKVSDARITVRLNGVTVQSDVAIESATRAAKYAEGPEDGPIYLQDHGDEVRFRNIWLQPRDAVREAARPIVPGFERFFANADDSKGLGGEILISTLGCVSCHAGAEGVLPVKRGPDLTHVGDRVRPDALVNMIADPHKTKRGTTMPDPWMGLNSDQRQSVAKSIASYLTLAGGQSKLIDRPSPASAVKRGQTLYHSVGCVACHQAFDSTKTPAATTVPLGDLASKYTVDSLANLIAQPHRIRSGGRMPSLVDSPGDAYSIASYLTRHVTQRENNATFRRSVYKGPWKKLPDFQSLTPVSADETATLKIDDQESLLNTAMVFTSQIRVLFPGKYVFHLSSDDGSRLKIGSHVLDNDGIHAMQTRRGEFDLDAGVYPVRVEWFNGGGGGELKVEMEDPLRGKMRLHELITDNVDELGPLMPSEFRANELLVNQGQALFQSTGCASCHQFGSLSTDRREIPAMVDVRAGQGCLATSVTRPAVDFHLSPRQKSAIQTAIQLRKQQKSSSQAVTDEDLVHMTMAGLNCYACHQRNGTGGPEAARNATFQTTTAEMGWESRLPPPLDGAGDKLKQSYLKELFARGANDRPYMLTRMPGFGAGHLDLFRHSLERLDRHTVDDENASSVVATSPDQNPDASPDQIPDGRTLVGATGLSCIKCHSYDGVKGGGLGVLDLLTMTKRLRSDWFFRYLQDPTKYRPGTRMPNSFPEGKSAYTKLYDGDPDKQVAAMWAYLIAGKSVKEPRGLRAGSILLTPTERPRLYRNFFRGVSARGIAVGYPDQVNLIWDAERMGLNQVWKNEFIDAARHWTGRGQGRTEPAGDQVHQLEPWTPLVRGDSAQMDWPERSGRESGYRFGGYRLDEHGNPTFTYDIEAIHVQDSIVPDGDEGFVRTLTISSDSQSDATGLVWRLARADQIRADGGSFRIGPLRLSVSGARCEIVRVGTQSELRAVLPAEQTLSITQHIQW